MYEVEGGLIQNVVRPLMGVGAWMAKEVSSMPAHSDMC